MSELSSQVADGLGDGRHLEEDVALDLEGLEGLEGRSGARSSYSSGTQSSSGHEAREAAAVAARMKRALPVVANLVSSMKVTSPEVLRATPAYRPFQRCGQAFDPGLEKELSKRSYKVERITTFWSHSWHGPRWPKALTLMVIYNGRIAVCLGTLAAFLMMILFSFQLLPGFSRLTWDDEHLFSYWCTMTGSIVSFLTFIFWRPHQLVFFDRMCIPENDSQLKAEAIYSLAGILNNSSSMLVLWDASWSERLWCLFELAAFLKSQKGGGQCLEIRPSILGPSLLFVFLTVSVASAALAITPVSSSSTLSLWIPITSALLTASAVGAMAMSALRSYFRSVEALEEKLKLVALDGTHCTCCEKHRPPWPTDAIGIGRVGAGQLVKECLKIWFGSEEDFENYVRSEVWQAMSSDLQEQVFSLKMCRAFARPCCGPSWTWRPPISHVPILSSGLLGGTWWMGW
ncbi:unnamed protein product [Durusdinium trenchii]|uniref:Uncharacterized protein n=2 Tax=Durusdinium trenchii TaxID=1381693 RepID=A0ABP0RG17_9DINO